MSNTATISYQWAKKGKQPQIQCKQRQRERQTVFGSYNYDSGQITVSFADRGNGDTFKKHLKKVLWTYKGAPKIIMVLDNVAYHHSKKNSRMASEKSKIRIILFTALQP